MGNRGRFSLPVILFSEGFNVMKWLLSVLVFFASAATADQLAEQIASLAVPEPTGRDPVSVVTTVIPTTAKPGETVTVVVKARMLDGWRIYRYVPPTAAYLPTKWILELPKGIEKQGDWEKPAPEYLAGEADILIYQGEVVFLHKVKMSEHAKSGETKTIKAGLNYQTCNNDMCLRPTSKVTDVAVTVR